MLKFFKKLRQDRGDAVLVTVIIAIPLFMLAFMFSVGMAMNSWQKVSYQDSAQAAAQTAASAINSNGWLGEKAINTFTSEYMRLTDRASYSALQIEKGGYSTNEASVFACNTVIVDGNEYATPYIEIRLDRTRGMGTSDVDSPLYVSVGGATPVSVYTLNTRVNYRVLSATVYEASSSLMGDGFAMMGEDAGCFTSRTEVSGITFGANEDISNVGGDTSCWIPSAPTNIDDVGMKTNGSIKLYTGADYTCPVASWINSPYLVVTDEYGSFFKVTVDGADYWVNSLDLRPADTCSARVLTDRTTSMPPTQYSTGYDSDVPTYSAPFIDCLDDGSITGEVTVRATYKGVYDDFYQLSDGRWVHSGDVGLMVTVRFNANGGSGGGTVRIHEGGTIPAFTPNPTRTGYRFDGWATTPSASVSSSFPRVIENAQTFYARWTTNDYSITWSPGGGAVSGCTPTSYKVTSGTITPNASTCTTKTRAGYTFTGWSPASIPAGSTGNKTFTAQWSVINYNITYNFNGGTVRACGATSYNVNSGLVSPTCIPTRTNYEFTGWSPASIPAGSTGAKTFTAQWKIAAHTITMNTRGGNTIAPKLVNHGGSYTMPVPTKSGWTFWGWSTSSARDTTSPLNGEVNRSLTNVTSSRTYYAHWRKTTTSTSTRAANAWVTAHGNPVDGLQGHVSCSAGSLSSRNVTINYGGGGRSLWTGWMTSGSTRWGIYASLNWYWGADYFWRATAQGHCVVTTNTTTYD